MITEAVSEYMRCFIVNCHIHTHTLDATVELGTECDARSNTDPLCGNFAPTPAVRQHERDKQPMRT